LNLVPVECIADDLRQACLYFRLFAVTYSFYQEFPQGFAGELYLAENIEHLAAKGLACFLEFVEESAVNVTLTSLLGYQVPEMADLGLADAVNPSEPLLDTVGVPWQVVVDHEVSTLKVDALTGCIGRQEYLNIGVVTERFLDLQAFLTTNTTMDDDHGLGTSEERSDSLVQVTECVAVLGEEDQLLVRGGYRELR
jgi:hypothetical protein